MDPENPTPLEESPDVSLQDIFRAVKQQGDINSKLRQEFIDLKNEQNSNSSPFGNLSPVDIPDSRYIQTCPARAEVSLEFNKEPAMVVDLNNTGGIDAHLILKQSASQKRNDFIKDEFLNISSDNQSSAHYLTHDYFEYEQGQAKIIVKGRLKRHIDFWYSIGCYDFIIDTILHGYKIPFYTTPPSVSLQNNRSAITHSDFVLEAIDDLLIRGLIIECTNDKPLVVNPLTVSVQNNGKKRLILDLRHVNLHLWKTSVKFEDIRVAMQFIKQDFYCFKFDILSAYHHLDIYEPHTDYLGFSWTYGESTKYFKFLVLPFGLSSACYIFTKVTRPLIKKWRGEGKQILMYLDDGFGTHSDINSCTDIAAQVKQDLIDSGFVPKVEKSMWSPKKTLIYLGYFIDTDKAILSIPVDRLSKLFDTIKQVEQSLRNLGKVYVRTVASVIGQIISMSYVIGNVAYIMTKYLSIDVMSACSWKSYIELSVQSKEQLIFWKKNIKCINFKHFVSDFSCHTIVYSDASGTGYGGFTVENPKNIAHGMWHENDVHHSSTWKELTAVKCVFHSLIDFMRDKRIKWFTDNQNVVSIVHKGSMKPYLQDIAYDIFVTCLKYNVSLEVEWIPRAENEIADYISRIIDTDDWGVAVHVF
ncbi:Hypothetical predicted protein [Mytilus galloprovincialis]|uniref:Reverse transcriptase domain-containing protein n=1 Tax=Mytilus galloprovincialis TaxID=29158 RepID=A0A8B6DGR0_MYTGA|nr:Hypothetical predicted protein [Mytilus galloprovincialis]